MVKAIAIVVLAATLPAACSKAPPDCARAVSGAVDRMIAAGGAKSKRPDLAARLERIAPEMKTQLTAACTEDHWAQDVIACLDKAPDKAALDACDKRLSPEQRAKQHKRTDEILRAAIDPTAGAPAGSAAAPATPPPPGGPTPTTTPAPAPASPPSN